jgi:hypothetical protein
MCNKLSGISMLDLIKKPKTKKMKNMSKYRSLLTGLAFFAGIFIILAFTVQHYNNICNKKRMSINLKVNAKEDKLSVFEIITLKYL